MFTAEVPGLRFYGLADGQSGKSHCREGGTATLEAVYKYIAGIGLAGMLKYEYMDELCYAIIKTVRDCIAKLAADADIEKTELASTIVVFAYDHDTGIYASIHLGDGAVIGCRTDGAVDMISAPDNGITRYYTWLTTSQDALLHLRISFGNISTFSRILMITDGASVVAHGKNVYEGAKQLIQNGSQQDIADYLNESCPVDDASCFVIDPDQTEDG